MTDWSSLQHAFGPATGVPALIAAAASPDAATRTAALDRLFETVWHQGTVYEATAPAVPLLVALARGRGADRGDVLELLRLIRTGQGYAEQHASLESEETRASEAWQETVARERTWVAAASGAVDAALPDVRALALDPAEDPFVRQQAVWLWWTLGPPTPAEAEALAAEAPPLAVACLVVLSGRAELGRAHAAALPRVAAALVDARGRVDDALVERILALLPATAEPEPRWKRLPGAHPRGPAMALMLPLIQRAEPTALIPRLSALLPELPRGPAGVVASGLVFLALGQGSRADLAAAQAALRALARSDGTWAEPQDAMLQSFGLPATRAGVTRLAEETHASLEALRERAAALREVGE